MGKFFKNVIIILYIILVIFVTICLLSYNDYKVTEFGSNSLILVTDEDLSTDFKKGDLLIVKKNSNKDIKIDQNIFFYTTRGGKVNINYGKVVDKEDVTTTETTYTVEGDYKLSSEYVIGKGETATVIPKVGFVLSVLESKWGFLLLVVFPTLIAFLYEIYSIILEVKDGKKIKEGK